MSEIQVNNKLSRTLLEESQFTDANLRRLFNMLQAGVIDAEKFNEYMANYKETADNLQNINRKFFKEFIVPLRNRNKKKKTNKKQGNGKSQAQQEKSNTANDNKPEEKEEKAKTTGKTNETNAKNNSEATAKTGKNIAI